MGAALLCSTNADAPSAQNTPVRVVTDEGVIIDCGGLFEVALKTLGLQAHAKEFGDGLESALLVCRTTGAVHIMNGEEQTKSASLQVPYCRRVCLDHHGTDDLDGAGGKRFSIYFNKTKAAGSVRVLHALEVAEVGDVNAVVKAGVE
jgi:hypothetical protein